MSENPTDDAFYTLCVRDLSGETTPEEKCQLSEFCKNPDNLAVYENLKQVWDSATDPYRHKTGDMEKAWNRLQVMIHSDETEEEEAGEEDLKTTFDPELPVFPKRRTLRLIPYISAHPVFATAMAAAACFAVGISISTVLMKSHMGSLPQGEVPLQIFATQYAQQSEFELPDGSSVRLNAGSNLVVSSRFGSAERRVTLTGEAFFNVQRNESSPFIVESGNVTTRVLGTQFNVSAFPNDPRVAVTLVNGSVAVTASADNDATPDPVLTLTPGQQYRYDLVSNSYNVKTVNTNKVLGWMNNRIVLDNEPVNLAFNTISRYYDVQFTLKDDNLSKETLSLTFDNEPLENVLGVLELTGQFRFKRHYMGHRIHSVDVMPGQ